MEWNHKHTARLDGANGDTPISVAELHEAVEKYQRQLGSLTTDVATASAPVANESVLVLSIFRLAQRCTLLGDQTTARQLYQLLLPFEDRIIALTASSGPRTCAAAYFVGLVAISLADWDAAAHHFHRALDINERIAATYEAAQTRYAYASVLVIRDGPGDWEQARHLLSTTVSLLNAADLAALSEWPTPESRATAAGGRDTSETDCQHAAARNVFRPMGDYWTLAYESKQFHLREIRGLQYIARLLRHPHQDVHVLDLVGVSFDPSAPVLKQAIGERGLSVARLDEALPLLDPSARRAYVARLRDLRADLADAAHNNDLGRSAALEREIQFLADALLAASRPGGRCATTASPAERARISVRNAITGALKAIAAHHRELAQHLGNAIRTGTTCCYAPDRSIDWLL